MYLMKTNHIKSRSTFIYISVSSPWNGVVQISIYSSVDEDHLNGLKAPDQRLNERTSQLSTSNTYFAESTYS